MATTTTTPKTSRTRTSRIMVIIAVTLAAFLLGPMLFSPAEGMPAPSGAQLPLFILLSLVEASALGLSVAFALFGAPEVRRRITDPTRARVAHLAITWALGSWWLHDNLHMSAGMSLNGLLAIEYAFHVTLIGAAAALIWALAGGSRRGAPQ